jgi:hypothetical protein
VRDKRRDLKLVTTSERIVGVVDVVLAGANIYACVKELRNPCDSAPDQASIVETVEYEADVGIRADADSCFRDEVDDSSSVGVIVGGKSTAMAGRHSTLPTTLNRLQSQVFERARSWIVGVVGEHVDIDIKLGRQIHNEVDVPSCMLVASFVPGETAHQVSSQAERLAQ